MKTVFQSGPIFLPGRVFQNLVTDESFFIHGTLVYSAGFMLATCPAYAFSIPTYLVNSVAFPDYRTYGRCIVQFNKRNFAVSV